MRKSSSKTVFIVCTTDSMISSFLFPYIEFFTEVGYSVRCFCSRTGGYFERIVDAGIDVTEVPFTRNPLSLGNVKSCRILSAAIKEDRPELVYCHEPVGGAIGRIAAKMHRVKTLYMVHGLHFFKGAPLINWLLYCPIEYVLAFLTDTIITINSEDYQFAKKHIHAKRVAFMHGVGIATEQFAHNPLARMTIREEYGFTQDDIVILSVGELNRNKNHMVIIKALRELHDKRLHCVIAGVGDEDQFLLDAARKYGLQANLHLLGYRTDCYRLYSASDIFCLPSYREGLSVALIEAMASGLPIVASRIRGNIDLVDTEGGFLFDAENVIELARAIAKLGSSKTMRRKMGLSNAKKAKYLDIEVAMQEFGMIVGNMMPLYSAKLTTG